MRSFNNAADLVSGQRSFGRPLREMTGPYNARNLGLVTGLYFLDFVGRLHSRRSGSLPAGRPLRILVANWGHRGDVVTILPLLELLKGHPRVTKLGLLVGSWSTPIVEAAGLVDRVHILDHWILTLSDQSPFRKVAAYQVQRRNVIAEIAAEDYDLSVDLFATFPSTHRIMWQANVPVRAGFASAGCGRYLTHPRRWEGTDEYVLTKQLRLLDGLITNLPKTLPPGYPNFRARSTALERLAGTERFLVMHVGSGDLRAWAFERWIALGHALARRGWSVVLTGANGMEAENARILADQLPVQNLAGMLSWTEFVTIVSKAAAVISVDTVTGHLAACFNVPAIVLTTGRTRPLLWRPNRSNVKALIHPTGCAPCHRTKGCTAMACVRMIKVEEVLASLDELLPAETVRSAG